MPYSSMCVCVCARCKKSSDWCNLLSTKIVQLATYLHPKVARWSRGAHLHSQTNTCHVDYASNLGCEQVASSSWDLGLMLLLVFKERLKYTTPTYMKTQKKNISPIKCITYKVLSLNNVLGFGDILDIFRFSGYFVHFLSFGGILVIFWVLRVLL